MKYHILGQVCIKAMMLTLEKRLELHSYHQVRSTILLRKFHLVLGITTPSVGTMRLASKTQRPRLSSPWNYIRGRRRLLQIQDLMRVRISSPLDKTLDPLIWSDQRANQEALVQLMEIETNPPPETAWFLHQSMYTLTRRKLYLHPVCTKTI